MKTKTCTSATNVIHDYSQHSNYMLNAIKIIQCWMVKAYWKHGRIWRVRALLRLGFCLWNLVVVAYDYYFWPTPSPLLFPRIGWASIIIVFFRLPTRNKTIFWRRILTNTTYPPPIFLAKDMARFDPAKAQLSLSSKTGARQRQLSTSKASYLAVEVVLL